MRMAIVLLLQFTTAMMSHDLLYLT